MKAIRTVARVAEVAENVAEGAQARYHNLIAGGANFTTGAAAAAALTVVSGTALAYALPAAGVYALIAAPVLSKAAITVTAKHITKISCAGASHLVGWVSPDIADCVKDTLKGLNNEVFTKTAQANHAGVLGVAAMYCFFPGAVVIPFAGMLVLKMAGEYKSGIEQYAKDLDQAVTEWTLIDSTDVPSSPSEAEGNDHKNFAEDADAAQAEVDGFALVEEDAPVVIEMHKGEMGPEMVQNYLIMQGACEGDLQLIWEQEGEFYTAVLHNVQDVPVPSETIAIAQRVESDENALFYSAIQDSVLANQVPREEPISVSQLGLDQGALVAEAPTASFYADC